MEYASKRTGSLFEGKLPGVEMSCRVEIPRVIVGAQKGGAGKTFFTLGLISALRARGFSLAPFKKGPDYIDAGWLSRAARSPCRNLDPFLMEEEVLLKVFARGVRGANFAVIEGNRGLFDGVDWEGSCSTAQLSRILKIPVILVLDCTKVTRSIAALLKGFSDFEPGVRILGVVLNRVARLRHERIITQSIERYTQVLVLGALPRVKLSFPERHLGLIPWPEFSGEDHLLERLRKMVEENIDLDRILSLARESPPLYLPEGYSEVEQAKEVRVGVFVDQAFQFYYPDNLEALVECGAEIVYLNAFSDRHLPDLDALYIGGGFPETQGEALADNVSLRQEIREAAESGLPIYAECGGLMFLGRQILWRGKSYPMVGALPLDFEVRERPQGHGYVVGQVIAKNPFYQLGTVIRGHEFHYSCPVNIGDGVRFAFRLEKGHGFGGGHDGVLYRNVLGAYTHVHALGVTAWATGLIAAAKRFKMRNFSLHSERKEVEEEGGQELSC